MGDEPEGMFVLRNPVGRSHAADISGVLAPTVAWRRCVAEESDHVAFLTRGDEVERTCDVVLTRLEPVDHALDRDNCGDLVLYAPVICADASRPRVGGDLEGRPCAGAMADQDDVLGSGWEEPVDLLDQAIAPLVCGSAGITLLGRGAAGVADLPVVHAHWAERVGRVVGRGR